VVFEGLYWMQACAYATFSRGANQTGGPLSQSKVQQQPLGVLADSIEGEWLSPLHRETGADHGWDKNKEQTPSIDCRGDGKHHRPVVKQLTVCASTQLPHATAPLAAREVEGEWDPVLPGKSCMTAHKSPSLLFDEDLVVNFATYTRVYMVIFTFMFDVIFW